MKKWHGIICGIEVIPKPTKTHEHTLRRPLQGQSFFAGCIFLRGITQLPVKLNLELNRFISAKKYRGKAYFYQNKLPLTTFIRINQ